MTDFLFPPTIVWVLAGKALKAPGDLRGTWANSSPWVVSRGPGNIAKVSPSGKLKGWYRSGQTSGKPSKLMPMESDVLDQERAYLKTVADTHRHIGKLRGKKDPRRVNAGVQSGRARQSTKVRIETEAARVGSDGYGSKKKIASTTRVSARHVRRTLNKKRT